MKSAARASHTHIFASIHLGGNNRLQIESENMQKIGERQTAGGNLPFANARAHQPMTLKGKSGDLVDAADARAAFRALCCCDATLIPCTINPHPAGERVHLFSIIVGKRASESWTNTRERKPKENNWRKGLKVLKIVTAVVSYCSRCASAVWYPFY